MQKSDFTLLHQSCTVLLRPICQNTENRIYKTNSESLKGYAIALAYNTPFTIQWNSDEQSSSHLIIFFPHGLGMCAIMLIPFINFPFYT